MPVETTLFVPRTSGNSWKEVCEGESAGKIHAEKRVFDKSTHSANTFFLLVQNAAPCEGCNTWLTNISKGGKTIVVRYTTNHGGYGNAQGGTDFFSNGGYLGATRPNNFPVALFNDIVNHI